MIWLFAFCAIVALPIWLERRRTPVNDALRADTDGAGLFIKLDQGVTHYSVSGPETGPTVVAIHGLTTPSYVWNAVAPILGQMGFRVISYDLFGRGLSDRCGGAQTPEFHKKQLKDLLDGLQIMQPVTLLGYSMGGMIAADFAASYPSRTRSVVLICSAGLGYVPDRFERIVTRMPVLGDWIMRLAYETRMRRILAEQSDGQVTGITKAKAAELTRRGFSDAVLSSQRHMLTHDMTEQHRKLRKQGVRVAALWAELDNVIPLSAMGRLAQINRDALQEMVELASHNVPHTHAQEVAQIVRDISQRKPLTPITKATDS